MWGVPGLFLDNFDAAEGDIAVDDGEALQIGEWNGTTFTENMRITAAGRVGIGETSPSSKLHITATDNSGDIQLEDNFPFIFLNSTTNNNSGFFFQSAGVLETEIVYFGATDNFVINHNTSANNDLTLTSGGFFGIQQDAPSVRLQVDGGTDASLANGTGYIMTNAQTTTNIIIDDNEIMARNNGAESPLYLQNDGGDFWVHNGQGGGTQFVILDNGNVGIGTGTPALQLSVGPSDDDTGFETNTDGTLDVYTNNAQRARFTNTGFFGVGSTTINAVISASGTAGNISNGYNINNGADDWYMYQDASLQLVFRDDGSDRLRISTAGAILPGVDNVQDLGSAAVRWDDVYATNGTIQTSDIRLKKNITPLKYGLAEALKLRPVRYQWKDNDGKEKIGLIAQEVLQIIPEIVNIGDDENKMHGLNYSELTVVLIKAIQEQQKMIEQLKKKVEDLGAQISKQSEK